MPHRTRPTDLKDVKLSIDVGSTLSWLESMAERYGAPKQVGKVISTMRGITSKSVELHFKVVDKDKPDER